MNGSWLLGKSRIGWTWLYFTVLNQLGLPTIIFLSTKLCFQLLLELKHISLFDASLMLRSHRTRCEYSLRSNRSYRIALNAQVSPRLFGVEKIELERLSRPPSIASIAPRNSRPPLHAHRRSKFASVRVSALTLHVNRTAPKHCIASVVNAA